MDQEEVADISNSDNWPDFLNAAFYEMKRDFYLYLSYEEDESQGLELSIGNNTFGSNTVTVENSKLNILVLVTKSHQIFSL